MIGSVCAEVDKYIFYCGLGVVRIGVRVEFFLDGTVRVTNVMGYWIGFVVAFEVGS